MRIIVLAVGFMPDTYEVDEYAGTVTLSVAVLDNAINENRTISISISTAEGLAQGILH